MLEVGEESPRTKEELPPPFFQQHTQGGAPGKGPWGLGSSNLEPLQDQLHPCSLVFSLHEMPLAHPAFSPRLTQLAPTPGSASAPASVPRLCQCP